MSARGIFALAALAPAFAGCGAASYLLPQGTRFDRPDRCAAQVEEIWLPPDMELSCAAFAIEGSEASPPLPAVEEGSVLEPLDIESESPTNAEPEELPLIAPANLSGEELPEDLEQTPTLPTGELPLPPPVTMETEEEALAAKEREAALAVEAARNAAAPRLRESTDFTIGLLPDSIERDPAPAPPTPKTLPLEPPGERAVGPVEPARADYVNAPLSKLAGALRLHGKGPDGRILRPGLVAGLKHRLIGEREPPEAVPFVVYERVAPKFFPVPTRPAFEPASASFMAGAASVDATFGAPAPKGFAPPGLAPPPVPSSDSAPPPVPGEEALPRPLPTMEALPLPQPGRELPPAPRLDDES